MAIPNGSGSTAAESKALDGFLEVMKLFCEVQSTNQNFIPATTLVWERGETLRPDPLQEMNIRDIPNGLVDASAEFSHAPLSESDG
jgi:hypothetical protein|tara:strand:+ start:23321 stop:23578 length:258 start_codon:yes stop_codon:yes gene_type:complete